MSACSPSKAGIIAVPFINLETVTARGPRKHYSVNFLNTCLTLAGSSCHWIVFSLLLKLNIISFNFNLKEWSSEHITNLENLLKKTDSALESEVVRQSYTLHIQNGRVTTITSQAIPRRKRHTWGGGGGRILFWFILKNLKFLLGWKLQQVRFLHHILL